MLFAEIYGQNLSNYFDGILFSQFTKSRFRAWRNEKDCMYPYAKYRF